MTPVSDLFGISIAAVTMEQVLPLVDAAIAARRPFQIGVVNAAKVVNMQRDARLRDDVLASDIVLADGMSLVWASRLVGRPLPERVAGIDLMFRLLERAEEKPEGLIESMQALARAPSAEGARAFYELVQGFRPWEPVRWPEHFMQDTELPWLHGHAPVEDV